MQGNELVLEAKHVGDTTLTLWFADPNDKTKEITLTYLVRIYPDPEEKLRLEQTYKALAEEINRNFPDSSIRLTLSATSSPSAARSRTWPRGRRFCALSGPTPPAATPTTAEPPSRRPPCRAGAQSGRPAADLAENFEIAGGPNVVNLLHVAGEQQVMLHVVVAEMNRTAARSIGLNFSVANNNGMMVFSNSTGTSSSEPSAAPTRRA